MSSSSAWQRAEQGEPEGRLLSYAKQKCKSLASWLGVRCQCVSLSRAQCLSIFSLFIPYCAFFRFFFFFLHSYFPVFQSCRLILLMLLADNFVAVSLFSPPHRRRATVKSISAIVGRVLPYRTMRKLQWKFGVSHISNFFLVFRTSI